MGDQLRLESVLTNFLTHAAKASSARSQIIVSITMKVGKPTLISGKGVGERNTSGKGVGERNTSGKGVGERNTSGKGVGERNTSEKGVGEKNTSEKGVGERNTSEKGVAGDDGVADGCGGGGVASRDFGNSKVALHTLSHTVHKTDHTYSYFTLLKHNVQHLFNMHFLSIQKSTSSPKSPASASAPGPGVSKPPAAAVSRGNATSGSDVECGGGGDVGREVCPPSRKGSLEIRGSGKVVRSLSRKGSLETARGAFGYNGGTNGSGCYLQQICDTKLTITDAGQGLTTQEMACLLNPYGTIRPESQDVEEQGRGTGLWLVIAKRIIGLHNGSLIAETQEGIRCKHSFNLSSLVFMHSLIQPYYPTLSTRLTLLSRNRHDIWISNSIRGCSRQHRQTTSQYA